jgi:hypothetical protein
LLKENAKVIMETKDSILMPNHIDSLGQLEKKLHPWVKEESERECVQQPKEMEICAHDRSKANKEYFESGEGTLPLCFSSFKTLKKNVYNVSNQTSSRHDVEYPGYDGLINENNIPLCFSSFELLKENHEVTKEEGNSDCNSTTLHKKMVVDEEDQRPSHALNDHVANYMGGYFSS